MESREKSKKVAKEKRSVKKSKTVALPAKEIPAAPVEGSVVGTEEFRQWDRKALSPLQ